LIQTNPTKLEQYQQFQYKSTSFGFYLIADTEIAVRVSKLKEVFTVQQNCYFWKSR